ncbi:MAG: LysM peptidoglycan-binding domain-containing protein [Elusimicrobiota bacterium]
MRLLLSTFLAALLAAAPAAAGARLQYEGLLRDAQGRRQAGIFLLHFRLWNALKGGKEVWTESRYVQASSGTFRVRLGERTPIPATLLSSNYRLSVETPSGTGWTIEAVGPVQVSGLEPAPVPSASGRTERSGDGGPSAAELKQLKDEMERLREEARSSKEEAEKARARVDTLELRLGAVPVQEKSSRVYVVKPGDTLRSIAQEVYGSAEGWAELYRANDDRIQRGGELVPGQLLVVPKGSD